jgi:hypothetical protein
MICGSSFIEGHLRLDFQPWFSVLIFCIEGEPPAPERALGRALAHPSPQLGTARRDGGAGRRSGLVASRMAYVSVSHAQFDLQMYTNDAKALGYDLSRDASHPTAIQQEPVAAQKIEPQSVGMEASQGLSVG